MGGNAEGRAVDEQKFGEAVEGGTLITFSPFGEKWIGSRHSWYHTPPPYQVWRNISVKKSTAPKQALEKLECFLLKRDAPKTTTASSNLQLKKKG